MPSNAGLELAAPQHELPGHVLFNVLDHLDDSPSTLLNARQAALVLSQPASDLISTLLAREGELPPQAWSVFRKADALHVLLALDHYKRYQNHRLQALFSSLPTRLRTLTLAYDARPLYFQFPVDPEATRALLSSLAASPAAASLTHVDLTGVAVNYQGLHNSCGLLAASLSSLRSLELDVVYNSNTRAITTWSPLVPAPGITRLHLNSRELVAYMYRPPELDMAGLAAMQQLQELHIDTSKVPYVEHHITALAALTCLTSLALLEEMPYSGCELYNTRSQQYWQLLQQLPQLKHAELTALRLPCGEQQQPLDQLTSLVADIEFDGQPPAAGWLGQLLPALRSLTCPGRYTTDAPAAATALQGHSELQQLSLTVAARDVPLDAAQPVLQLHTLAALRSLQLSLDEHCEGSRCLAALVAEAACCPGLQELSLKSRAEFTAACAAVLAAGRCSKLQRLELHCSCSMSTLAVLLGGGPGGCEGLRAVHASMPGTVAWLAARGVAALRAALARALKQREGGCGQQQQQQEGPCAGRALLVEQVQQFACCNELLAAVLAQVADAAQSAAIKAAAAAAEGAGAAAAGGGGAATAAAAAVEGAQPQAEAEPPPAPGYTAAAARYVMWAAQGAAAAARSMLAAAGSRLAAAEGPAAVGPYYFPEMLGDLDRTSSQLESLYEEGSLVLEQLEHAFDGMATGQVHQQKQEEELLHKVALGFRLCRQLVLALAVLRHHSIGWVQSDVVAVQHNGCELVLQLLRSLGA